jgi:hypothetical protein
MAEQRRRRPGEATFAILMLLVGCFLIWQSLDIEGPTTLSSPAAFPLAASVMMTFAALIVLVRTVRMPAAAKGGAAGARMMSVQILPARIVIFAAMIAGYAVLLGPLGFLPASFLFLFAAIQFLWRKHPARTLTLTLASLAGAYCLFRLVFQVVLPEGIVPEREIIAWVEALFAEGAE